MNNVEQQEKEFIEQCEFPKLAKALVDIDGWTEFSNVAFEIVKTGAEQWRGFSYEGDAIAFYDQHEANILECSKLMTVGNPDLTGKHHQVAKAWYYISSDYVSKQIQR